MPEELNYPRIRHGKKKAQDRRRRILVIFVITATLTLSLSLAWKYRKQIIENKPWAAAVKEKAKILQSTPPDELLKALRNKVSAIQDDLEKNATSDKIEENLRRLRKELETNRDRASVTMRENWQILLDKSDTLVKNAREQKEKVPQELDEIKSILKKWEADMQESYQNIRTKSGKETGSEEQSEQ